MRLREVGLPECCRGLLLVACVRMALRRAAGPNGPGCSHNVKAGRWEEARAVQPTG